MSKYISFVVAVDLLLLAACSPVPSAGTVVQPTETLVSSDYFPLRVGSYWIYEGTVLWTEGTEVKEAVVDWRMEVAKVVESVHDNGVTGYIMKGHPADLAWYEEDKQPSDYVIIQTGMTRFYYAGTDVLRRLQDEDDDLYALLEDDGLFLDIPLLPRKKFCAAQYATLHNGGYCWIVGEGQPVDPETIIGLEAPHELVEYGVWKGTGPDDTYVGFIPGVGISRYRYNHHGTVSHVEVVLVEYHSAEPGGS